MIEGLDEDVADASAVRERRDDVVARVREHAGQMAWELARLEGGEYGRRSFRVDGGEWTVKHEAGELEFLRFEGQAGLDVYVVSTHQPPEPEPLARAMEHYAGLVDSFEAYVRGLDGVLDGVPEEFPEVASAASVADERDRVVSRIRGVADEMAGALHRVENTEYGTFAATVEGTRWELKRELDRASYVRVGGAQGVYLVSQYGPPSARDLREYAPDVASFVAAFNEDVASLSDDLDSVSL
ncbi:hypothetical protein [Halobacterium litoreum]|uniref:Profilin fold domain-containing protein n=1 Tax=Halobacterium litoreum TaxID=2039234 RepID=A0ABD5NEU0_9EURY|nr:hypothetical protein [Halobacterium litoreum]UHH13701.1 hypothetical protein LT972_01590 [Halobacterium litoreum]